MIGKGYFSIVKMGVNKETGDKVAIKIFNRNNMDKL